MNKWKNAPKITIRVKKDKELTQIKVETSKAFTPAECLGILDISKNHILSNLELRSK